MTMMEDISSGMDVETIIVNKNIIDSITIEIIHKIVESKKSETQSTTMVSTQATTSISLKQPTTSSHEEVIKVAPPKSILKVIKESTLTSFTIMALFSSLPTNVMSFSTNIPLEVHSSSKINYFANLPIDCDDSNDEFDPYIILYQSNFIVNEFIPHFRSLTCFDSSTIILKIRVLKLKKMINIYQSNMDELERTKLKLSKCKGENIILNVQIQILKIKKYGS
jgi:hypothetical protein